MNRWGILLAIAVSIGYLSMPASAKGGKPSAFDLYSWKDGNEWDYSLLPVSPERKADVEIKRGGGPLRGAGKIKQVILDMNEGDTITWQQRAEQGMVFPPDPIIQDIKEYAQSVGVKVLIPGKPSND